MRAVQHRNLLTFAVAALLIFLGGCASSTRPGAVGIQRSQLLMVPSDHINTMAAEGYNKLSHAATQAGRLNKDPAMTKRVREITSRLIAQVSAYRPDAVGWSWEVNVIESEKLNAFCMPGGKMAIFSGLITRLELTDEEVAAVMGHEIAHALREHSREQASQETLTNAIAQGIANSNSRNAALNATLARAGAALFMHLPFSREMELEADVMGLELMARAGYDPSMASGVWAKMQRHAGSSGTVEFFNTHPNHDRRIAAIHEAVPKVSALYTAASGGQPTIAAAPSASATSSTTVPPPSVAPTLPNVSNALVASPTSAGASTMLKAISTAMPPSGPNKRIVGQDAYQAERAAKSNSCHPSAQAAMLEKGPGFEVYAIQCTSGEARTYRCEFGNCAVVSAKP